MENPLRQDLWRAGHAHAGVWLILALVALRYVDDAELSNVMKWLVRGSIPIAALLVPAAFFLSVLPPDATVPNALIYLAYVGAVVLAAGVLILGIGLGIRDNERQRPTIAALALARNPLERRFLQQRVGACQRGDPPQRAILEPANRLQGEVTS